MAQDQGQISDQFTTPQVWTTNVPGKYGVTMQNRAAPNTAGTGNVGGEAQEWLDSTGKSIGTADDRGLLSSRAFLGITGEVKLFPLAKTMVGFLLCDGSPISRTVYADLFAYLGTTFGVGDGSTTFNLPNYRDVTFGGIGPATFLAPQTVYGSNAPVNLQHSHSGDPHTHQNVSHTHPNPHTHPYNIGHNHNGYKTTANDSSNLSAADRDRINVQAGTSFFVSGGDHRHWDDVPTMSTSDVPTGAPSLSNTSANIPPDTLGASAANTGLNGSTAQSLIQATMGFYAYIKT